MSYLCPLCQQPLVADQRVLRCASHHQFDRAKEGYVNLLPVQHKRSKQPGDSPDMMQARRNFLDAGHYQPLQQRVCDMLDAVLPSPPLNVLDIGCGEGYYTQAVAARLQSRGEAQVFGLDVAKVAIRYGAKRYRNVEFCVASSHRLPFGDAQFDAVLRIYAPCKAAELSRVVRPGGYVLTVTPGPRHLMQFKALIYQEVVLHDNTPEEMPGFTLVDQQSLGYPMTLNSEESAALLQMTPFAWRARPEVWGILATTADFACETDFTLRLWQRQDEADDVTHGSLPNAADDVAHDSLHNTADDVAHDSLQNTADDVAHDSLHNTADDMAHDSPQNEAEGVTNDSPA